MDMDRKEHVAQSRERALAELERSGVADALASLMSDFSKHEATNSNKAYPMLFAMALMKNYNKDEMKKFIEGFN